MISPKTKDSEDHFSKAHKKDARRIMFEVA